MKLKLFIFCAFCVLSQGSRANDIYIAQNPAGANNGMDAADAFGLAWNTSGNWAASVGPGTEIHLVGTITGVFEVFGSGTTGSPILVHGEPGSSFSSPSWTSAAVYGPGCANVILDSMVISNSNNGTALGLQEDGSLIYLSGVTNFTIRNCLLTNCYVRTPGSPDANFDGIDIDLSGAFSNVVICNNSISQAKYGISAAYYPSACQMVVYSNRIWGCSVGINAGDGEAGSTLTGITISNNVIDGCSVWAGSAGDAIHCDALHIFAVNGGGSYVSNTVICANIMGPSMGGNLSTWPYTEGVFYGPLLVYNNLLLCDALSSGGDGFYYIKGAPPANGNVVFANNTIYTLNPSSLGVVFAGTTTNAVIVNNIFYNVPLGIYTVSPGNLAACDYNVYYGLGASGCFIWDNTSLNSLAAWQSASGFDGHSRTNDPLFVNAPGGNFNLYNGSAATGAGTNLSAYFTTDAAGNPRPATGAWDIGAYQHPAGMTLNFLTH